MHKCISPREGVYRDLVMQGVHRRIAARRIPASEIVIGQRPISVAQRAAILRGDYQFFSLRMALLLSDVVGGVQHDLKVEVAA